MLISGVTGPRPEQQDLVEKHRLVFPRLFLPEGSLGEVGGTEEGLRLQELSNSQAETGAASLFTPGGGSDFTARVFWEKLSFPHLDGGRAQLLLPSQQSLYSHSCQAWGRCCRVLRGRHHLISFLSGVPRQRSHRDEV